MVGDPERLLVFRLSCRLNDRLQPICDAARRGAHFDTARQVERAAGSITLNIAEGAAEFAPREKARIYRIARRSTDETRAGLYLIRRQNLVPRPDIDSAIRLTIRLSILLLRLIRSMESRPP